MCMQENNTLQKVIQVSKLVVLLHKNKALIYYIKCFKLSKASFFGLKDNGGIADFPITIKLKSQLFLVLDFNGLFVKTSNLQRRHSKHGDDATYKHNKIQFCIGAINFFNNICMHFRVCIWSSMKMNSIMEVIDALQNASGRKYNFEVIWDQQKCLSDI